MPVSDVNPEVKTGSARFSSSAPWFFHVARTGYNRRARYGTGSSDRSVHVIMRVDSWTTAVKDTPMKTEKLYEAAYPFADDVLALPVEDLDRAVKWYGDAFGLSEIQRRDDPAPAVILERDGVQIGFAVNGGDAANEGAAIRVTDIQRARDELEARGVKTGSWRVDKRDGRKLQVFFVVAPDGLCYYFHQPIGDA